MKLWQKIFLCTLVMVILAVNITSTLLVFNNHKLVIEREERSALLEHEYLISNMKSTIIYNRLKKSASFLSEDEVLTIMKSMFNNSELKSSMGISIYNNKERLIENKVLPVEVEKRVLEATDKSSNNYVEILDYNGQSYMIIGSEVNIEGKLYKLISSCDITPVYTLYKEQMDYVKFSSLICAIVVAGVLIVIVRVLLFPLQRVNEGTKEISHGNYDKRLEIKGHDEIAEVSMNMNLMTEAIEKNVNALKQVAEDRRIFIANLAHEMKTPLTSILGFADILRVKRNVNEEEIQEYTGIIIDETKRLKALSGKLMELITIGTTNVEFKEVELKDIIEEIEITLRPIMEKQHLNFITTSDKGSINIDKELFKSLLYNLIDNAVKASQNGKTIELMAMSEGNSTKFKIIDEGIGIAKKEIEEIVKPFYMVDKSRTRQSGGAGLGLALCVEIARLHNGTISIESEVEKGTCITIDIKGGGIRDS